MPSHTPIPVTALLASGVDPQDERVHDFPPGLPEWQESVFYDWIDAGGQVAGHCRIGLHPDEGRVWFWLFLTDGDTWWAIEAPHLPWHEVDTARWAFTGDSLQFERTVLDPLRSNGLRITGTATAVRGDGIGQTRPVSVDLRFDAVAPPHTMGARDEVDGNGQTRPAARFEQPMAVTGHLAIGDATHPVTGWGERDHSWGSRHWAFLDWTFLILHSDSLRLQCADVRFGGAHFVLGFVMEEAMEPIGEATLDLDLPADLETPCSGRVRIPRKTGPPIEGTVEGLGVVAIDLDHVYRADDAPQPIHSVYRRALIRFHPADGGEPLLGWVEWCRRPAWLAEGP